MLSGANICGLSILKTNWGVSHGFELWFKTSVLLFARNVDSWVRGNEIFLKIEPPET